MNAFDRQRKQGVINFAVTPWEWRNTLSDSYTVLSETSNIYFTRNIAYRFCSYLK